MFGTMAQAVPDLPLLGFIALEEIPKEADSIHTASTRCISIILFLKPSLSSSALHLDQETSEANQRDWRNLPGRNKGLVFRLWYCFAVFSSVTSESACFIHRDSSTVPMLLLILRTSFYNLDENIVKNILKCLHQFAF